MNGGAVAWRSTKQSIIPLSSKETEFINVSEAAQLVAWMKKFIRDLDVVPSIKNHMKLYRDNVSAILLANEPLVPKGSRHIFQKFHYIHRVVERNGVEVIKVHTDDNIVDPLTKASPCDKHGLYANGIRLRYLDELSKV
ncbi:hypothetical protein Tco_1462281 [Tanacetum coccineum]